MIKKNTNGRKSNSKKLLLIGGIILLLAGGGAVAARHFLKSDTPNAPAGVKLAPATKEEKKESEDNKDRIIAQQKDSQTQQAPPAGTQSTTNGKKQVSVVISSVDSNMLSAYVTGVFEEGGTCTATFTQANTVVTRTSSGFENVSYTQCAPISPNLPSGGSWSVVVSYSSASAQGTSPAKTF